MTMMMDPLVQGSIESLQTQLKIAQGEIKDLVERVQSLEARSRGDALATAQGGLSAAIAMLDRQNETIRSQGELIKTMAEFVKSKL